MANQPKQPWYLAEFDGGWIQNVGSIIGIGFFILGLGLLLGAGQ